jgi:Tol biopolymer transport system component
MVRLTREFLDSLPVQKGVRILRIALKAAPYQDVEKAEVEVDPHKGLTVRFRRVRAFKEDIEREGVPASRVLQLDEGTWVGGLTASPTEDRLAFSVVERVQDDAGNVLEFSTIRAIGGAGGGITQLTTGRWLDTDPCFSHDGENLYFASNRLRGGYLDLSRIYSRAKGGGIAAIHSGEGWSRTPSTAAGGLLAFGFRPEYRGELSTTHVWTLGGTNQYPTQLREGANPEVSPDGSEIVYVGPDNKLWKISLLTNTVVQLTTDANTSESDPTWSRDGAYIIFVSDKGLDGTGQPNNDIWMIRKDGTDERQLTTNGSDDVKPVVSFDQKWIYFVSNRGYKWSVWRIPWASGAGAGD